MNKSFTLIELLIVIGILAILVVTILITLNPSEAQKKTRDAKRMKDLATLQAIALQWINDGNQPITTSTCPHTTPVGSKMVCDTGGAGRVSSQPCDNNWLGVNVCRYTNSVPLDPLNTVTGSYVCGGTVANPVICSQYWFAYLFAMNGSDYKIGVMQESKADAGNVLNDGGTGPVSNYYSEVGSDMSLW